MGFFSDLFSGNFSAVEHDVTASIAKLPTPVQAFIAKLETDDGVLLSSLATTAFEDVVAGGFTTASFVNAGKSVVAAGLAQGKKILLTDAIAAINIQASAKSSVQESAPVGTTDVPVADDAPVGTTDAPSAVEAPTASTSEQ